MSVVVSCRCGQRFAAEDHLIGQQVPCPVCGSPLTIGAPPVTPPSPITAAAAPGVRVDCQCGRAFLAPETLRGTTTPCPACGGAIQVPSLDPLDLGSGIPAAASGPSANPLYLPGSRPASEAEVPWRTLGYIGAVGLVLLVIVISVTSIRSYLHERREVVEWQRVPPAKSSGAGHGIRP